MIYRYTITINTNI